MTTSRICRICSCTADYDIFAKIPTYLHSNTNEFLNWQKPINLLIEEATGLKVSKGDGLPEKICALCISYLKHAVSFREQTINNALNLQNIIINSRIHENAEDMHNLEKVDVLVTSEDLSFIADRETDITKLFSNYNQPDQNKVKKQLLNNNLTDENPQAKSSESRKVRKNIQTSRFKVCSNNANGNNGQGYKNGQCRYKGGYGITSPGIVSTNSLLEEDLNTTTSSTSGEESEDANMKDRQNFFSYEERNFEEDDIIDLDELRGAVTINIPETCKERKCRACFRRFMFEDTYNDHLNACIELKFLNFVEEINRLLEIRKSKSISPHEFIRRMIFALRKVGEWLKQNYVDDLLSEIFDNGAEGQAIKRVENEIQNVSVNDGEIASNSKANHLTQFCERPTVFSKTPLIQEKSISTLKPLNLLDSLNSSPINISNNILYEIERSESRQKERKQPSQLSPQFILKTDKSLQKPIPRMPGLTSHKKAPMFIEPSLVFKELATAQFDCSPVPPLKCSPISGFKGSPILQTFTARCPPCNMTFNALSTLELHNQMHHNKIVPPNSLEEKKTSPNNEDEDEKERNRIIALFEENNSQDG